MYRINYFKDLVESMPDYKKSVLLMFVIKEENGFLNECGFLKNVLKRLYEQF